MAHQSTPPPRGSGTRGIFSPGRRALGAVGAALTSSHRARAFARLGAKNAPHAIYLAIQRGLIPVALTVAA